MTSTSTHGNAFLREKILFFFAFVLAFVMALALIGLAIYLPKGNGLAWAGLATLVVMVFLVRRAAAELLAATRNLSKVSESHASIGKSLLAELDTSREVAAHAVAALASVLPSGTRRLHGQLFIYIDLPNGQLCYECDQDDEFLFTHFRDYARPCEDVLPETQRVLMQNFIQNTHSTNERYVTKSWILDWVQERITLGERSLDVHAHEVDVWRMVRQELEISLLKHVINQRRPTDGHV